jgi:hypothetical protein
MDDIDGICVLQEFITKRTAAALPRENLPPSSSQTSFSQLLSLALLQGLKCSSSSRKTGNQAVD